MKKKSREIEVFDMIVGGIGRIFSRPFQKIFSSGKKISWQEVEDEFRRLDGIMRLGGEAHFRQAVIEADNFLDKVLKSRGALGKTLGERLKNIEKKFNQVGYQSAWNGHKLRNRIVHEHQFELLSREAQKALSNLKNAIKDLV
ncbi:hypothetical protein CO101_00960 [Candidatus Berkelbacteria bacterium CG_4_9_14_3_um_filter_39_23]|uniref:DUF4145 domain-containing protein n=2 Tax=Candidatus Berkelbacteria TaxID=1618330 RepID=A0A2M7CHU5_9BACT|nr:hypothetical protein [Candidatus Berkelbacteria bacterium]OIP05895.1 MAG: hypothetical protein AUK14_00835 [Candidatus Berkelbacteria bacterium CG2_30_39_44]PIR27631.1 MAG: hypothetical protein COV39_03375 [Candidatus Berkelbacteria bacterium CG11_big_fil_rev_8_21_14_0_20_40_23]PIV25226.1 MAG: hypothetical protein COS38_02755 [Candidatus Berkelbacteria bacterium CG03_land_8_20_14_0_80_40_36]PIX30650.1 MAG: hypothetical protein COZ62_01475 [Candidatus Berkelbacteria bacterium CG_4_8_14_3_um_f